jgi:hypothetical protein
MEDFWLIVTLEEWKMKPKPGRPETPSERLVRDIRRVTRKQYGAEDKIRIVLDSLHGECSIAELCRREGIAESLYYSWSKERSAIGSYCEHIGSGRIWQPKRVGHGAAGAHLYTRRGFSGWQDHYNRPTVSGS